MKYITILIIFERLLYAYSDHHGMLDKRLLYYEPLHYDRNDLHLQHIQVNLSKDVLHFKFHAFNRNFSLELKRAASTSNIILHHNKKSSTPDFSYIYSGRDTGYPDSEVRMAVINRTFQGKITHPGQTTYHIVPSSWLFKEAPPFHTVIYSEKDYNWNHTFSSDTRENVRKHSQFVYKTPRGRTKRDLPRTESEPPYHHICTIKLTTDTTVWKYFMDMNQNEDRSRYEISFLLESHVAEANNVFRKTEFTLNKGLKNEAKVKGIQFEIRGIHIMTEDECEGLADDKKSICNQNLDGLTLLKNFANGEQDPFYEDDDYYNDYYYDDEPQKYCLSFLITARVLYSRKAVPLLGYSFRAEKSKSAGVCDNRANNGFITLFQDTTQALSALVTQLVFSHEIAHAFGAIHDNQKECSTFNLKDEPTDGFYLMHSIAQRGDKPNHRKLSDCSVTYISQILSMEEYMECFTESELPFCGNGLVDDGEQCDCGTACDIDSCCHPHNATGGLKCMLKLDAQCSSSQGPCCHSDTCRYINRSENFLCHNEQPCMDRLYCHGEIHQSVCSPPNRHEIREDGWVCNSNGRVCNAGSCNASICKLIGWRECQSTNDHDNLTIDEKQDLCYVGCQKHRSSECISTNDLDTVRRYPELENLLVNISYLVDTKILPIQFPLGMPCNRNTGYCDVFRRCRGADPDTPLVRLKQCLANHHCIIHVFTFVRVYWWAVLLGSVAGITLFFLFVKCCAVHTKSSNPIVELRHPHRSVRQSVTSIRQSIINPQLSFRISVTSMRDSFRRKGRPVSNELAIKKFEAELEVLDETPSSENDDVFV